MTISPRLVSQAEAAQFCGIAISTFRLWQAKGLVPGPWRGTRQYDLKALANAIDKGSNLTENVTSSQSDQAARQYDAWVAGQHGSSDQDATTP